MFNQMNKNLLFYIVVAALALFAVEFVFVRSDVWIWLLVWGGVIYLSWRYYYRPQGRIAFWVGCVALAITIMDTMFFRLIIAAIIFVTVLYFYQHKTNIKPEQKELQFGDEPIQQEDVLFSNQWFGKQTTGDSPYQWQDINYQTLAGETVINLNKTVLPKGEPIIVMRHLLGSIKIIVPYDVEVSIHHSVMIGSVNFFGYGDDQLTNRTVHYQTANYQTANQRIKIYTSMLAGKIEVKRG
ncbi:cell wall-active antibiotics response protein LiaF [Amphibacillus sediminis]|uniref:cell wall-active antibiotics response protein LiaF n=1 Tax=Amphibacillus sediminis TaxID=360185 RepID=UPI00082ECAC9|nr:cell wall-active antibiotics response protein LiaF [Amphibacillus sediminis]